MLVTIWFALWGVLWAVYFLLDGFDLGIGAMLPFLTRDESERRAAIRSMGPFWDGNEVWLITAGGVTFAAFPGTYAVMFSALYSPLMLLLFALIVRGIAIEFRGKLPGAGWRRLWDACLWISSLAAAVLLGVAFANIFAGVPIDGAGHLRGGLPALLNPYGLLGGLLFLLLFLEHGALWLALKSEGALRERAARAARGLWPLVLAVAAGFLAASAFTTALYRNFLAVPALFVLPGLAVGGLVMNRVWQARAAYGRAWMASGLTIVGATLWGVAGLYPNLLPSSLDPAFSLSAHKTASSPLTLGIMLGVALVMLPVVIAYQAWTHTVFFRRIDDDDLGGSAAAY